MSQKKTEPREGGEQYRLPDTKEVEARLANIEGELDEILKQGTTGLAAMEPVRFMVLKTIYRLSKIQKDIDIAFGGQLLFPDFPPYAPANACRVRAYFELHDRTMASFWWAMEMWVLVCGVRMNCGLRRCPASNCPRRKRRKRTPVAQEHSAKQSQQVACLQDVPVPADKIWWRFGRN